MYIMSETFSSITLDEAAPGARDSSFYDTEWADQWQDMKAYSPVARHTRRLILRALDRIPHDSLIDIGCGIGSLLQGLVDLDRPVRYAGVDFSEKAVRIAARRLNAQFTRLDVEREWLDETFDIGVCSEVLEHLEDDSTAIVNIAKMCRNVVITVPSGPLTPASIEMGHVRHYTKTDLTGKIEAAGLRVLSIRAWGTPFHDPLYAWLRSQSPDGATTGTYGPLRRALSAILYLLFHLNVIDRGHKLIAVAERIPGRSY